MFKYIFAIITTLWTTSQTTHASAMINQHFVSSSSEKFAITIHQALRIANPLEGSKMILSVDPHYNNPAWDTQFSAFKTLVRKIKNAAQLKGLIKAFAGFPTGNIQSNIVYAFSSFSINIDDIPMSDIDSAIQLFNSFGTTPAEANQVADFFEQNYNHLRTTN